MLKQFGRRTNAGRAVLALLLSAPLLNAGAALAHAPDAGTRSRIVETGDLDLHSAEGRRERDRRVLDAARQVCRPDAGFERYHFHFVPPCIREAVRTAQRVAVADCPSPAEKFGLRCIVSLAARDRDSGVSSN